MIQTSTTAAYTIYYSICWQDMATGEHYSEIPDGMSEYDADSNPTGQLKMCFDGMVRNDQTGELFHAARELTGSTATYTEVLPEDDPDFIPAWRQPGENDPGYDEGALVRAHYKIWASEFDGNKFEPGPPVGYGWTEVWPWTTR